MNRLSLHRPLTKMSLPQLNHTPLFPLQKPTMINMIRTSKKHINLLQWDILRLRYDEPHKHCQANIDTGKHVEGVESLLVKENGEELLTDDVGDILGLGSHADGLRADVHGEDFGGPDPGCCAPGWFV